MDNQVALAKRLLIRSYAWQRPVIVPGLVSKLFHVAQRLFNNEEQRHDRTWEEVQEQTMKMGIEYAFAERTGCMVNPNNLDGIDPGDPETHAWDVEDAEYRYECKNWGAARMTVTHRGFSNFFKNKEQCNVQFLVAGSAHCVGSDVRVVPKMVCRTSFITKFIEPSEYAGKYRFNQYRTLEAGIVDVIGPQFVLAPDLDGGESLRVLEQWIKEKE